MEYGVSFGGSARSIGTSPSAERECEAMEPNKDVVSTPWSLSEVSKCHSHRATVNIPIGLVPMTGIVHESLLVVGQDLPAHPPTSSVYVDGGIDC